MTYNNELVDLAESYCYLGVIFNRNGLFNSHIEHVIEKTRKAYFKNTALFYSKELDTSCKLDIYTSL